MTPELGRQTAREMDRERESLGEAIVEACRRRGPSALDAAGVADLPATLAATLYTGEPAVFLDWIAWSKDVERNRRGHHAGVDGAIGVARDVLFPLLPDETRPAVERLLERAVDTAPAASETCLAKAEGAAAHLARLYVNALREGRHEPARRAILEAAGDPLSLSEIYLDVLGPALQEIGRLWQRGETTVAHEHLASALTQVLVSILFAGQGISSERRGGRLLCACVEGERHQIGPRMVADLFDLDGWDTVFLGADTPPEDLLALALEAPPAILALSVTVPWNLLAAARLIELLRSETSLGRTRVLVGGQPFERYPGLGHRLGADAETEGARAALRQAAALLAEEEA